MATQKKEVIVDISINSKNAKKGSTDLKSEFKALQKELRTLAAEGDTTSKRFLELESRAGELKDRIGDMNDRVNLLSSDFPKLDLAVGVAKGIAAGFAAAQGAMALFGGENKNLEKALLKVQGAMALLQGITELSALTQKNNVVGMYANTAATKLYTFVTSGATLATKAFRAALVATGFGAIIFALGSIVSLMSETKEASNDVAEAIKSNADLNAANYDREARLAKAKGDADVAYYEESLSLQSKVHDNEAALLILKKAQADEYDKDRAKKIKEITSDIENLKTDINILDLEYEKSKKEKEKKDKEEAEKKKKAAQDAAKERERLAKEEADRARVAAEKLRELEAQAFELKLKDQRERDLFALISNQEKEKAELKNMKLKGDERIKLETALQNKQNLERVALLDKFNKEDQDRAINYELDLKDIKDKGILQAIKDDGDRALKELEFKKASDIRKLDTEVLTTEEKNKKILEIETKFNLEKGILIEDITAKNNAKLFEASIKELDKNLELNKYKFDQRKALLDLETQSLKDARDKGLITEEQYNAQLDKLAENRKQLVIDEKEQRKAANQFITDQLSGGIATATNLIELNYKKQIDAATGNEAKQEELRKKYFERKKSLDIASALVATYSSAVNAFNSTAANTALTALVPAAPAIAAAAAVAAGLANVAKIRAQKYTPSGGSASGGSASTPTANFTPTNNATGITPALPKSTDLGGKTDKVRAYVVETDISSKQKRVNKLQQNSRL